MEMIDKEIKNKWIQMYKEGKSIPYIAKKFNSIPQTIRYHLVRNKVDIREQGHSRRLMMGKDEIDKSEWIALYKSGRAMDNIAKEYDCDISVVKNHLVKNNIKIRNQSDTLRLAMGKDVIDKSEWITLYNKKGKSAEQIGREYNCDSGVIRRYLEENSIDKRSYSDWYKIGNPHNLYHFETWINGFEGWCKKMVEKKKRKLIAKDITDYFGCNHNNSYKKIHEEKCEKYYDYESNISSFQTIVEDWLNENNIKFTREFRLARYKYDIYIKDKNVLIEVNPTETHNASDIVNMFNSTKGNKNYHLNKTLVANKKGYRCIHIFDKDLDRLDLILGFLKPRIKLGASKCKLVKDVNLSEFLSNHHRQGGSGFGYALTYKGEIIGGIIFRKTRNKSFGDYELFRLCYHKNYNVIAGSQRLFTNWMRDHNYPSVISYCDRAYNMCNVYERLGFKFLHNSDPNYKWVKKNEWLSRETCQRHKLAKRFNKEEYQLDKNLTEKKIMESEGYVKVYDCGNKVYVYNKKEEKKINE